MKRMVILTASAAILAGFMAGCSVLPQAATDRLNAVQAQSKDIASAYLSNAENRIEFIQWVGDQVQKGIHATEPPARRTAETYAAQAWDAALKKVSPAIQQDTGDERGAAVTQ